VRTPARPKSTAASTLLLLTLVALVWTSTACLNVSPAYRLGKVRVGVSLGDTLPGLSAAALDAELTDIAALGATTIRVDFDWSDVEHNGPTPTWTALDRIVTAATAHHLQILALITHTPAWARPATCTTDGCAPANPATFATYAKAAATRYAPKGVHLWEVWNEPNEAGRWGPAADATSYGALLSAAVGAIRKVDSGATIISGGLASTDTRNGNVAQLDFLDQLCATGALDDVDGVGYHPYSYPVLASNTVSWNAWSKISANPVSMTNELTLCGAPHPIWATEYGAPTNGPGVAATVGDAKVGSSPDHVDEALQAAMATDSITSATRSPFVAALLWYSYKDAGTSTTTRENFFGLRRYDGTAKPAWSALAAALGAA
jgi:hypothetical protein